MYPQLTCRDRQPGGIPRSAGDRVQRRVGLQRLPRPLQQRPRHRVHRPFPGRLMLIALLAPEVDAEPAVRSGWSRPCSWAATSRSRRQNVGGDFPTSRRVARDQTGCVVAYSSFDHTPPANSLFGRVGNGINPSPSAATDPRCCASTRPRPAAARGARALLSRARVSAGSARGPAPTSPGTPWVAFPNSVHGGSPRERRNWLQITTSPRRASTARSAAVARPDLGPAPRRREHRAREPGPDVRSEAAAYTSHHRP